MLKKISACSNLIFLFLMVHISWTSELKGAEKSGVSVAPILENIQQEIDEFDYQWETFLNFFPLDPLGSSEDDEFEILNKLTLDRQFDIGDNSILELQFGIVASSVSGAEAGLLSKPTIKIQRDATSILKF